MIISRALKTLGTSWGIMVSQVLNILFIPVLSRVYSPENYTEFGVFLSISVIVSGIASGKFADAISTTRTVSMAIVLTQLSIVVGILLALIGILFTVISAKSLTQFDFMVFTFISAASLAISNIAIHWLFRQKSYRIYSILIFLVTGIVPILQFLTADLPGSGLIHGAAAAHLLGGLLSLFLIPLRSWKDLFSFRIRHFAAISIYKSFPMYSLPSYFLSSLRTRLPYFILSGIPDRTFLGLFTQVERLSSAPSTFTATALRPIATEALMSADNTGKLLFKYILTQWLLFLPPTVFVYNNSQTIIKVILGSEWTAAAPLLKMMLLPGFLLMTTIWLDRFYDFYRKHVLIFNLEIFFGSISALALVYWGIKQHDPAFAIQIFSIVLSGYYISWLVSLLIITKVSWQKISTLLIFLIFSALFLEKIIPAL